MTLLILVWLADVIESLGNLAGFVGFISFCVLVITGVIAFCLTGEESEEYVQLRGVSLRVFKHMLWLFPLVGLLAIALPSKNTYYTMLAAYGVEYVATSERVVDMADNSFQLLEQTIGSYLEEVEDGND